MVHARDCRHSSLCPFGACRLRRIEVPLSASAGDQAALEYTPRLVLWVVRVGLPDRPTMARVSMKLLL